MNNLDLKEEVKKAVKYGLVGVMNTTIFATVAWIASLLGLNYMLYTLIGYAIAIVFSFFMNKQFTFNNSDKDFRIMFLKFICVTLSLLGCVQVIQYYLIGILGLKEFYGVVIGMVYYTGTGFFLNRFFVFREKNAVQAIES